MMCNVHTCFQDFKWRTFQLRALCVHIVNVHQCDLSSWQLNKNSTCYVFSRREHPKCTWSPWTDLSSEQMSQIAADLFLCTAISSSQGYKCSISFCCCPCSNCADEFAVKTERWRNGKCTSGQFSVNAAHRWISTKELEHASLQAQCALFPGVFIWEYCHQLLWIQSICC